jgi:hypothetical protein
VHDSAVIPVFGLTCTSLVAQGANERIGDDHVQPRSEGKPFLKFDTSQRPEKSPLTTAVS